MTNALIEPRFFSLLAFSSISHPHALLSGFRISPVKHSLQDFPIPPKSEIRNPLTFPQNIREKPYKNRPRSTTQRSLLQAYTIYPIAAIVLLPILTKNLCRLFSGPAPCICDPAQDATPLIPYPLSPCGHQAASSRERLKLWRPCRSYLLRASSAIKR